MYISLEGVDLYGDKHEYHLSYLGDKYHHMQSICCVTNKNTITKNHIHKPLPLSNVGMVYAWVDTDDNSISSFTL